MNNPVFFDLSLIKPMFIRAISNMEAVKQFTNYTLGMLISFVGCVISIFVILSILYFVRFLRKNKDNKEIKKSIIKESFLECRKKIKYPLWKCRYIFIGGILMAIARILVSLIFYIYGGLSGYDCTFSPEENRILGIWATLGLIIFLIAPTFIMFCFGNKFIRNIGILIYIFGAFFIAMGKLISISCAGIEYEKESEEVKSIKNLVEVQNIEEFEDLEEIEDLGKIDDREEVGRLRTHDWNGYKLLPDSAEISVENTIIEGEAVNLKVTILKNGSKMTSYEGIILMFVTDENGIPLKENEFTLPSNGIYTYSSSDLGEKEFQRGLEINKEGTFYIEIQDLNDYEDKLLGRQKIVVTKKS